MFQRRDAETQRRFLSWGAAPDLEYELIDVDLGAFGVGDEPCRTCRTCRGREWLDVLTQRRRDAEMIWSWGAAPDPVYGLIDVDSGVFGVGDEPCRTCRTCRGREWLDVSTQRRRERRGR